MAEPLVLIPGMACDMRVFEAQVRALGRDRAVMIALPTQGERVEEIASNLLMQLPLKFALVGTCFGGAVAMEILRRAPERVQRIALISTTPLTDSPQQAAERETTLVKLRAGSIEAALRELMPPEALAEGRRLEILHRFIEMGIDLGPEVIARQVRALQRRKDQQPTLRKVKVPALVVCGAEDGLTPPKRHEFMSELIPYSRLAVIEGAGHLPSIEAPDAVTEELRTWLSEPLVLRSPIPVAV
ncbi:alpha/beta fold hydrolase [Pseudooceanicola sp. LIPI14-2-Ac024]|uniref:alpha/beta fold hydrolase n=1 Tax=Pseudooceanicola sp. LIPI14-2-Ac024 TaxID=3344875 RepID=UPI0035D023D8